MLAVELGMKVRACRESLNLTQEQLAEKAGISRNQIQNIEHSRNNRLEADGRPGSGNPRLETLLRLASALEVEPGYLVDPSRPLP